VTVIPYIKQAKEGRILSGKKPKSVSFNENTNERDKELLEWLDEEKISFAPFVKDLIYSEMLRRKAPLKVIKQTKKGGIQHVIMGNTPPLSRISV
jgi:hypothetical protein